MRSKQPETSSCFADGKATNILKFPERHLQSEASADAVIEVWASLLASSAGDQIDLRGIINDLDRILVRLRSLGSQLSDREARESFLCQLGTINRSLADAKRSTERF